jgi:Flp pilus assembly protein TadD
VSLLDIEREFERGMTKFREGNVLGAMVHFEKAVNLGGTPECLSFLGYCIAKERGQACKGLTLCREAIDEQPENPVHYLNMAKIHLLGRKLTEALDALRQGASFGPNEEISQMLEAIGTRKPPAISFLHRDNPINKYLGVLLGKLGMR